MRDAADADRTDPEAAARAQQFVTRAEQFESQAAKAEAAGRTKRGRRGLRQRGAVAGMGPGRGRGPGEKR